MTDTLSACNPALNAVVQASAGTGKTWLLVSRIIRILLNNQSPDNILAITFTRKAAAEMQNRLLIRLFELATCDREQLDQSLVLIGLKPTSIIRNSARRLYEQLLQNPYPLKTTTFHSFCQDLLRRFPLEADVPPGFELLENSNLLQNLVKDELFTLAAQDPNGCLAQNIEIMFDRCGGLDNTLSAMRQFLNYRIDWWAYTYQQSDAVVYASDRLKNQLNLQLIQDPLPGFFINASESIQLCADLLNSATTKTAKSWASQLEKGLNKEYDSTNRFTCITKVFFTNDNNARFEKTIPKSLSDPDQHKLARISEDLCRMIKDTSNIILSQNTFLLSQAWYYVGDTLVNLYQKVKEEQRILDFSDLEWKAFQLLTEPENKYWVQYKLDQRVDHILVDEFQDTNPTQWRLLLPLLEEMAAGDPTHNRSVFLVGDSKQSIYRFRRADPSLFDSASTWLSDHMSAKSYPQNSSRRSAKVIMDVVNQIFSNLDHFPTHTTHLENMHGMFVLLPLIQPDKTKEKEIAFRNPLLIARNSPQDTRYYREGQMISQEIHSLLDAKTTVHVDGKPVYLDFKHIIILVKNRTHIADYEKSLRDDKIPFIGTRRGSLLLNIEVNDIIALLKFLITPFNNVDLATVLRSPLFSCSDKDLMLLAVTDEGLWVDRLNKISANTPINSPLFRANTLLSSWRQDVGKLPVHDLLDKIYCEGNVIARYESAVPKPLRNQTRANLIRFIELALEIDSGRYPSLAAFLDRLSTLKQLPDDAPNEGLSSSDSNRVRIMTIHGAKGLEAPVVFLADTANNLSAKYAYHPIVKWPTNSPHPSHFQLMAKKADLDPISCQLLEHHIHEEQKEDLNLLYVALTRARQYLYVSASQPNRGTNLGWYKMFIKNLDIENNRNDEGKFVIESGHLEKPEIRQADAKSTEPVLKNPLLNKPLQVQNISNTGTDSPSKFTNENTTLHKSVEHDDMTRGVIIHRMFELICSDETKEEHVPTIIANEFSIKENDPILQVYWNEVLSVFHNPGNADIFNPTLYSKAYNEAPIQYSSHGHMVSGIIDRVVVNDTLVTIVDYKTHQSVTPLNYHDYAMLYTKQLESYVAGARMVWPKRKCAAYLLFTHCNIKCSIKVT